MQNHDHLPWWKNAPLIRLLVPFMTGILIQYYYTPGIYGAIAGCTISILFSVFQQMMPLAWRYRFKKITGFFLQLLLLFSGMLSCYHNNIRHRPRWYGRQLADSSLLIVTVLAPPTPKAASVKAEARVEQIENNGETYSSIGNVIIYFEKDSSYDLPVHGSRLLISKSLQKIKGSGNPGAFDYGRYAAFQQLFHSVYLKPTDYSQIPGNGPAIIPHFLCKARNFVINSLRKFLPASPNTIGIAEALLIGYKEDLDRDLLQTYSNTGVVHIIAISGLHLGLLYVMLVWMLEKIPFLKRQVLLKALLVLGFLWFFALLTGASASVLRSAVMFTCVVIGKNWFRQASIYNSLAASAFLLLCYDPYFLWDVGFQLSYLAIYGIAWLQKPIFHLLYVPNKWLRKLWEMVAITVAAQVLTFPACLLYFHQFPNIFLLSNILAVPLSTIILFAEIFLIVFSWCTPLAMLAGRFTGWLISLMNIFIKACNDIPFAVTKEIYATVFTTLFLYVIVLAITAWIFYKRKWMFVTAIISLFGFCGLCFAAYVRQQRQYKMIVYNVPKYAAVDFIYQDSHFFVGDSAVRKSRQLQNFHLQPSRINSGCCRQTNNIPGLYFNKNFWQFGSKKVLLIDSAVSFIKTGEPFLIDILILSKNARVNLEAITTVISPSIVVFDGSNSLWKIAQWKKECEQLILPCFSVAEQGAFVLDLSE